MTGSKGAAPARGEELTTDFLAAEFKKAGLKRWGGRTYLHPSAPPRRHQPEVHAPGDKSEDALDLVAGDDFSGTSQTQTELAEFDAEAVFVGHGITAPSSTGTTTRALT